jgi:Iap family predicted aminopeptidase
MQAEYATGIVFRRQEDWQRIYRELTATAIHTVKPDHISIPYQIIDAFKMTLHSDFLRFAPIKNHQSKIVNKQSSRMDLYYLSRLPRKPSLTVSSS